MQPSPFEPFSTPKWLAPKQRDRVVRIPARLMWALLLSLGLGALNALFTGLLNINEVKVAPDGTILSRKIVQSSGNKAWDDAVLRAIDKTEVLPRDTDGRVPPVLVLGFRPLD